jgi:hypothetical protein
VARLEIALQDGTRVLIFGEVSSSELEPVLRALKR